MGHAAITGIEPEAFIDGLDNKILKALHVQDTNYFNDLHTIPYDGKINWDNVTKSLKNIDYQGDLTFEVFGFMRKFENDIMESVLNLIVAVGRSIIGKIEKV